MDPTLLKGVPFKGGVGHPHAQKQRKQTPAVKYLIELGASEKDRQRKGEKALMIIFQ